MGSIYILMIATIRIQEYVAIAISLLLYTLIKYMFDGRTIQKTHTYIYYFILYRFFIYTKYFYTKAVLILLWACRSLPTKKTPRSVGPRTQQVDHHK